jgi:hypothetical protein
VAIASLKYRPGLSHTMRITPEDVPALNTRGSRSPASGRKIAVRWRTGVALAVGFSRFLDSTPKRHGFDVPALTSGRWHILSLASNFYAGPLEEGLENIGKS